MGSGGTANEHPSGSLFAGYLEHHTLVGSPNILHEGISFGQEVPT